MIYKVIVIEHGQLKTFSVGVNGVKKITLHSPQGEGDAHIISVFFINEAVTQYFYIETIFSSSAEEKNE